MLTDTYFSAIAQVVGATVFLFVITIMPAQQGTMVLWRIGGHSGKNIVAIAMAAGAVPVGRSANGALIVQGERGRLMRAMLPHAVLPVAASSRLCGPKRIGAA